MIIFFSKCEFDKLVGLGLELNIQLIYSPILNWQKVKIYFKTGKLSIYSKEKRMGKNSWNLYFEKSGIQGKKLVTKNIFIERTSGIKFTSAHMVGLKDWASK